MAKNPYVLCEEYKYELTDEDLDEEEISDTPIDLFKIDIEMFPEKFLKGNLRLQNLALEALKGCVLLSKIISIPLAPKETVTLQLKTFTTIYWNILFSAEESSNSQRISCSPQPTLSTSMTN